MSVQSDVHQFLATVARGADGDYIPMDPGKVAEQVGTTRNKVNKTLFNLSTTEKIELQRGPNGRSIVGFKLLAEPTAPRDIRKTTRARGRPRLSQPVTIRPGQHVRRRSIQTPSLDEYAASKAKFSRLTEELGDLVSAEFRSNPYAEEGLALRERLDHIEGEWAGMLATNEEQARDLRALRRLQSREMAESVARSEQANGSE